MDDFHRLYYDSQVWTDTRWLGARSLKCPLDLWIYQEIISEVRPGLIVESGTADGGSALFMAGLCDLIGHGKIVTIDIDPAAGRPDHGRITYLTGSSTSPEIIERIAGLASGSPPVMVILDSAHDTHHVLAELRAYSRFVTRGSYLIVEDTNINGHPVLADAGPGPMEAVAEFLRENAEFEVDRPREKFLLTFNPGGYLRKVASSP